MYFLFGARLMEWISDEAPEWVFWASGPAAMLLIILILFLVWKYGGT